ncbi:hypothetical protein WA026_014910 [Henosepilachna vigintioctopunctata]|uniref:VWFC domain-containing protein n=1 Tax=Henosepilachna vigintioctopunctata TaxID=420089 RepID=A0AAW1V2M4_9CUCU
MKSRQCGVIIGSLAYFIVISNNVNAGPASRRLAREIYPEVEQENDSSQSQVCVIGDVVYGWYETIPAELPCFKCRCEPPRALCQIMQCKRQKLGCKMVHRPNQCCPDYQCECEYNNKKYSNGERLGTLPGDECKVCYCRGGEIKCTDVSCYIRNDCEGKRVPGQCCPKYDHCPIRDHLERMATSVPNANSSLNYIGEDIITTPPKDQTTSINHVSNQFQIENDSEIDALDPKKVSSVFIPQDAYPKVFGAELITTPSKDQTINHGSYQFQIENDSGIDALDPKNVSSVIIPRDAYQNVFGDSKIDSTSNLPMNLQTVEDKVDAIKNKSNNGKENTEDSINDLLASDSDAEPSEIEEVIHNPPPVIRIGDNLLFLRKNEFVNEKDASSTPTSIITLIGAEGLQRGGLEEVVENISNVENSENFYPAYTPEEEANDLSSESSSHILSLVKKKKKPTTESTTAVPFSTASTTNINVLTSEITQSSSPPIISSSPPSAETISQINTEEHSSTDTAYSSSPSHHTGNIELDLEQNPAYPTLPDIITMNMNADEEWIRVDSGSDVNQSISTEKINIKESRILPTILEIRNNKTLPNNVTNINWLKLIHPNDTSTTKTLPNINADSITANSYTSIETEENVEVSDETTAPMVDSSTSTEWEEIITSTDSQLNPQIETVEDAEAFNISEHDQVTQMTSKENVRSVEAVEISGEYSGESVTPKETNTAAFASIENASVEEEKRDSEVNDMLFVKEYTVDLSNDEEKIKSVTKQNSTNFFDVEIINTTELEKNSPSKRIHENLPTPEKIVLTNKTIHKRENHQQEVDEAVFAELQQELGIGSTEKPKSSKEEELEAKKIFQELLEETSTTKSQNANAHKTKDSEALEKLTQALTKLALKNTQSLDIGALSVLKDFFASQYKAYESKEP